MFVVGLVVWLLVGMGLAAGLWWWGRRRGRGLGPLLAALGLAVYLLGTYAVIRWHLDAVERELRRDPEKLRALREEAREAREAREEARERARAMEEALRARELELDGEGPSPPGDYPPSRPWRQEDLLPVPIEEFDVSRDTGRTKRP